MPAKDFQDSDEEIATLSKDVIGLLQDRNNRKRDQKA